MRAKLVRLLELGGNIDISDTYIATPMLLSVDSGVVSAVEAFLKHGANINHYAPGGGEYLAAAIQNIENVSDRNQILDLLIEAGASFDAKYESNSTTIDTAREYINSHAELKNDETLMNMLQSGTQSAKSSSSDDAQVISKQTESESASNVDQSAVKPNATEKNDETLMNMLQSGTQSAKSSSSDDAQVTSKQTESESASNVDQSAVKPNATEILERIFGKSIVQPGFCLSPISGYDQALADISRRAEAAFPYSHEAICGIVNLARAVTWRGTLCLFDESLSESEKHLAVSDVKATQRTISQTKAYYIEQAEAMGRWPNEVTESNCECWYPNYCVTQSRFREFCEATKREDVTILISQSVVNSLCN